MEIIEVYMMISERPRYEKFWALEARCFQDRCMAIDHFDEGLLQGPYHPDVYTLLEEQEHLDEKDRYKKNVITFINATCDDFRKDFGLEVWFSHVEDGGMQYGVPYSPSTITYLTLPKRVERGAMWHERNPYSHGAGLGMVMKKGRELTEKELHRFKRTMKILDLEVYVHPSQQGEGLVLGVIDEKDEQEDDTSGSYPQQMVLMRAHS